MQSHTKAMLDIINNYNKGKPEAEQIKFLHGGSSAAFATVGLQTTFINYKKNEENKALVPAALIPTGMLRKNYGLHPFSGELKLGVMGFNYSRKTGVSYKSISGMVADKDGMEMAARYAKATYAPYHQKIITSITQLDSKTAKPFFKQLMMYVTNTMLIDSPDENTIKDYLGLLEIEHEHVKKYQSQDSELNRYFNKYIPRIKAILTGKTPLITHNDSRHHALKAEVQNQYPVVFCSTIKCSNFKKGYGVAREMLHEGALPLDTIKILFTPKENKVALENKIKELKLDAVVYELVQPEIKASAISEIKPFTSLQALKEMTQDQLKDSKLIEQTVQFCLNAYFNELKSEEFFEMICWIIHHAPIDNIKNYLNPYEWTEASLNKKASKDADYLRLSSQYLHKDLITQFERLHTRLPYWYGLLVLAKKENLSLLDYKLSIDEHKEKLNVMIENDNRNFMHKSEQLEHLDKIYHTLLLDRERYASKTEAIDALIDSLKLKYDEIHSQYEPQTKNDRLFLSMQEHALYQASVGSSNPHKKAKKVTSEAGFFGQPKGGISKEDAKPIPPKQPMPGE